MEKQKTRKKFVTQGKHREFYLGSNVATLIYNCDETGFPLAPKPWKVLVNIRNIKHNYQAGFANTKAQITVLLCLRASVHYTNPLVIYPGVQPYNELCNHFHEMFEEGLFRSSRVDGWTRNSLLIG